CGSSGIGGIGGLLGGQTQCNPGTQVQLARPSPNQVVSGGIGSIEIVASDQNNILYSTYGQWDLLLTSNLGDQIPASGPLNLIPDRGGPQPYQSDYYYSASIQSLPSGRTWNVQLNNTGTNCTPFPLQSFST
ncbi:MAG: hypothetical protein M3Y21_03720, partial [Candidatus Eremiobacteraeota bacterium]|nr:hypothetical protein [Candidatus Eremiobacteraeota bacterium]